MRQFCIFRFAFFSRNITDPPLSFRKQYPVREGEKEHLRHFRDTFYFNVELKIYFLQKALQYFGTLPPMSHRYSIRIFSEAASHGERSLGRSSTPEIAVPSKGAIAKDVAGVSQVLPSPLHLSRTEAHSSDADITDADIKDTTDKEAPIVTRPSAWLCLS